MPAGNKQKIDWELVEKAVPIAIRKAPYQQRGFFTLRSLCAATVDVYIKLSKEKYGGIKHQRFSQPYRSHRVITVPVSKVVKELGYVKSVYTRIIRRRDIFNGYVWNQDIIWHHKDFKLPEPVLWYKMNKYLVCDNCGKEYYGRVQTKYCSKKCKQDRKNAYARKWRSKQKEEEE